MDPVLIAEIQGLMIIQLSPLVLLANWLGINAGLDFLTLNIFWILGWIVNVFVGGQLFYWLTTKSERVRGYIESKRNEVMKKTGDAGIVMIMISIALVANPSLAYAIAKVGKIKNRISVPIILVVAWFFFFGLYLAALGIEWVINYMQNAALIIAVILVVVFILFYLRGRKKTSESNVSEDKDEKGDK